MVYQINVRHGGKIVIQQITTEFKAIQEMRVGELMNINSYYPDIFPSANFAKCVDRAYELVNGIEYCSILLETTYK